MRILIVDDEPAQARQVATAIREMMPDAELEVCNDEQSASELIRNKEFDLAIFDLILAEEPTLEQQKDMDHPKLDAFEGVRLSCLLHQYQPKCKAMIVSASKFITKGLLVAIPMETKNVIDVLDKNMKAPHGSYSYRDYLKFKVAAISNEVK